MPPDLFQVIFPSGTVDGATLCDPCSIIDDDYFEGFHSFDVCIQGVTPDVTGITVDPRNVTVEIADDEGEWC